ncbi:MAG: DUF1292 domain-containing protein [Oscillospiraceae bacterium]|jgi:uncharacterized protein YrzB (UPF0473 family)|nr:DUF1292 domain-containing protein [Oscillospiraceae bacterium]
MNNENKELEGMEEFDGLITLTDDEGNEVNFEFLDVIEYAGGEYLVITPAEESEEDFGEVVILKIETDGQGGEEYYGLEDEELINAVFEVFKDKWKDEMDFE